MKNQLLKPKKEGGEKMKKTLLLTALVVLFAVPVMAASGIKSTKHNLGTTGTAYTAYGATNTSQICVFCHTPHNATQAVPLWNRNNPGGTFQLYTSSPTLNINGADRGPLASESISMFCLSCHDGATGIGSAVVRPPDGIPLTRGADPAWVMKNVPAKLGTDLSNDHPVNFSIDLVITGGDRGSDSTIRARTDMTPTNGGLNFFNSNTKGGPAGSYIECGTCHNPHSTLPKFLRKTNDSSSLCLTCHIK